MQNMENGAATPGTDIAMMAATADKTVTRGAPAVSFEFFPPNDVGVAARDLVTGGNRQLGDAAHEGAADTQNMNVHVT